MLARAVIAVLALAASASAQECEGSPTQTCRMFCAMPVCASNECVMRSGSCCDLSCVAISGGAATTGEATAECPDINLDGTVTVSDILALLSAFGSDDSAADINDDGVVNVSDILATLSAFGTSCTVADGEDSDGGAVEQCALGEDCGGQVWNECGSSCPLLCGELAPMICNMMCNAVYQCPNGQWFDVDAGGVCVETENDCAGGAVELPPGVIMGRPFTKSTPVTKDVPVTASVEERDSDWSL